MKKLSSKQNAERSELISGISKIVEEFNPETAKKILFDNGDSFEEFVNRFHKILNKDAVWEESILNPLKSLYNGVQEVPEHFQSFTKFILETKKQKDSFNFVSIVGSLKSFINRQDRENNKGFNYKEINLFISLFVDLFHCYEDQNYSSNQKLLKIFLNEDSGNSTIGAVGPTSISKNEDFRTIIFNLESYLSEFIDFISKKDNKKFLIIEQTTKQLMFSSTKIPGDLVVFELDLRSPQLSSFELKMLLKRFTSENPEVEFANLIKMKMDLWYESFLTGVLNPRVFKLSDFMENRVPLSLLSDEDILNEVLGDLLSLSELISLLKKLHPEDNKRIRELILPLI